MSDPNFNPAHAGHFRKKRRLTVLLVVALAVTLALVGWALLPDLWRKQSTAVHTPLPQSVSQQALNYTYTQSNGRRRIFTIHAERTQALEGSKTLLYGVHVEIYGPNDAEHKEIETGRCAYNTLTGALACFGPASILIQDRQAKENTHTRPPIVLKTSDISYDPRDSIVRTSQAAQVHYGSLSGSGVGLAYNTQLGWLALHKDASFTLTSSSTRPPVHVTAGQARYDRKADQIVLDAPVTASQGDRRLTALNGRILLDASNRVTQIRLSGSVKAASLLANGTFRGSADEAVASLNPATSQLRELTASSAVSLEFQQRQGGSFRRLQAQHVLLHFGPLKNEATDGEADGDVRLVFQRGANGAGLKANPTRLPPGAANKPRASNPGVRATPLLRSGTSVLSTARLAFAFRPGNLLRLAHTIGSGTLTSVPNRSDSERDTLTAGHLTMSFDPLGRLDELIGLAGTRITVQPAASPHGPQPPLESTAPRVDAIIDPASGMLKTARQYGGLRFWQGERRGSAREGIYQAPSQELTLVGHPVIWDSQSRIHAHTMTLFAASGIARGSGSVRSSHFFSTPGTDPSHQQGGEDPAEPPLVVMADEVIANRNTQVARYEGHVRAWHGPDVIESPSLTIYRKLQEASSLHGVVTSLLEAPPLSDDSKTPSRSSVHVASRHPQSEENSRAAVPAAMAGETPALRNFRSRGKAKPKPSEPVTITAARLRYFNIGEKAVYQGSVETRSGSMSLRSDRLDVYFGKGGPLAQASVTKAVAAGHVVAVQPPGRRATGEHAVYFVPLGKIVLTGGPPKLRDQLQSGFLTAPSLTFYLRNDSLVADGSARTPTLSRNHIQKR
jgi:lipopolysaccharide export system protein LptA